MFKIKVKSIKIFLIKLLNLLIPQRCLRCSDLLQNGYLCHECWSGIHWIGDQHCTKCSQPFGYQNQKNIICPRCLIDDSSYDKIFANTIYDRVVRDIILSIKFGDKTHIIKFIAEFMYSKILGDLTLNREKRSIICATPMTDRSIRKRKFNQSILIARKIYKLSKKNGIDNIYFLPDLLIKIKETKKQNSLSADDRKKNLSKAIVMNEKYQKFLTGYEDFYVIDDVITTGSTIHECSLAIKSGLFYKKITFLTYFFNLFKANYFKFIKNKKIKLYRWYKTKSQKLKIKGKVNGVVFAKTLLNSVN
jgi:predicted amidophosphoribosyltransferase